MFQYDISGFRLSSRHEIYFYNYCAPEIQNMVGTFHQLDIVQLSQIWYMIQ